MEMGNVIGYPLGIGVDPNYKVAKLGVIGAVETSMKGNTILRVGNTLPGENGWEQSVHVALTPDEREALIEALIKTRGT